MNPSIFQYGEDVLSTGVGLEICGGQRIGRLSNTTKEKIAQSREVIKKVVNQKSIVYGVTTGFGPLCTSFISEEQSQQLQFNLLTSHSVGVGELIPQEIAKMMLILKVQALAKGYSGVSLETIERIIWHIDNNAIPCVPAQGSVGASGDLAPLAHLFLPLIGLGEVQFKDQVLPADVFLAKNGLAPLQLQAKEGLALINGTQFMAAYGIFIIQRLQNCLDNADLIAAMMLDSLSGSAQPFHELLHTIRPHSGSVYVAQRMRRLLSHSEIMDSHINCERVQDPYSLRCVPQVHGASRNAWLHLKEAIHTEINSVTDNPIVIDENLIISGGNFHGQPIALPLDYAAMAAAEIGNISDRRIYLSIDGKIEGTPKLLMHKTGLNSGFMIPQYTTAALVAENKTLCFPASVDSIPTSLGQEDHVSMGSVSARKAYQIVDNLEKILGIELLYAAQGLDFRRPLKSSKYIDACHDYIRRSIKHRDEDELFSEDIRKAINMVKGADLIKILNDLNIKNEQHEIFGIY